jgi:hypothetical protein
MRCKMKWYTREDGLVCLGTNSEQPTKFQVVTDVKVNTQINTGLSESHIALIGSFPEDWRNDHKIAQKINNAAKHFFGLSHNITTEAVA